MILGQRSSDVLHAFFCSDQGCQNDGKGDKSVVRYLLCFCSASFFPVEYANCLDAVVIQLLREPVPPKNMSGEMWLRREVKSLCYEGSITLKSKILSEQGFHRLGYNYMTIFFPCNV